jgi:molecular chaperone DnaJ
LNPYEVLGVGQNVTKDELSSAYKKLARQYHPDATGGDSELTKKFKEVASAYEILNDPQKKAEYDRFGSVGNSNRRRKPFTSPLDDFFSSMFGGDQPRQSRGDHILTEHEIDLMDVLNGVTVDIKYQRHELCGTCNGKGGDQVVCTHCGGSGKKIIQGQAMTVQTMCPACEGTGKSISKHCEDCQNGFTGPVEKSSSFVIPKGVEDGMRFSFRGEGEPCADGPAGSLFVVVRVKPHDLFQRLPNGIILCRMPVSYTQLVLGDEVEVPTLDGMVNLKIPAGTQSDAKFKLKGQGLPIFNNRHGSIYKSGDELVQVVLSVPTEISDEYRELLEKLAAAEQTGE